MFYLGIDIEKSFHVASLIDDKKNIIFKGFQFKNTTDNATKLLETTGHYLLDLYSFLIKHKFVVHVVNPIQTDSWRNSTKIRPHKTDKINFKLVYTEFRQNFNFFQKITSNFLNYSKKK